MSVVAGIHPVREALLSGEAIDTVAVARGAGSARIQELVDLCRSRGIPLRFENRQILDRLAGGANHQGVVALGAAGKYADSDVVFSSAQMLVLLDGVEDPHNLGAVIRTVNAAGADAVVIPERRAAGLTGVVSKAAAGALAHVPVVRVGNLSQAIEDLKKRGYWIYGLDERGTVEYDKVTFTPPSALVLGSEGDGLHQQVRKRCDFLVRVPMAGKIPSLNVSVAAGIVLFEWKRRKSFG